MAVTVTPQTLTQPLGLLRLLQLVSTCVAFSCVAHVGAWTGPMGNWSMFTWIFCFIVTFIVILVELCGCQARFPLSWRNFPITYALYAALFCLSSSIIYPTTYVQFMSHGRSRDHAIAATTFSCIACLAYATEVAWTRGKAGEVTSYMATVPGLLKVLETYVACVIFAFLSNPDLYQRHEALEWCVAVYAICFILAAITILLNLGECTNMLPISFSSFLTGVAVLSVLMYATAIVIWPLYQFNEQYGGQSRRMKDSYCAYRHPHSVCNWDRRLAVAILTGINLLAYLADMVYSTRLVIIKM
ncbi:myeloid-associated differentiation marker [Perognathus longimembris pacificus]|uniref:myeloid-associated differentiation marker n=1 Tax=Perognathus longimembris pacificus TaxID=214514 RepID=UPI002018A081|nr:myeloid-associated differentiation marker [Perognathus longimembris pacificus]XP_048185693.1 myeloid-associated differentiation marker [Perognathus longimembris pacificus]XP_048185694.1 myeloid-associated differentiation marker [Perognathus longimembris pacificus]XP_048185695.1 myeloid-associated differentiation marker [Perognathus longimembris pacificus]XP_048185696.1 myeloid-associated differentiation marker [Perognathus longimembris pacificus]XP_048185697.1 myeloid-associated differentia